MARMDRMDGMDAAKDKGLELSKDESREIVYGMPYDDYKAKHQKEASPDKLAKFDEVRPKDGH